MRLAIVVCAVLLVPVELLSQTKTKLELEFHVEPDIVGRSEGAPATPQKALQDTVWIADWNFDTGSPCNESGWEKVDLYNDNDGATYWHVTPAFDGTGGIVGSGAALGYESHECCLVDATGYDNLWYQAIRIEYSGSGTLNFDYLIDTEPGFDFLRVELDSACASFSLVDHQASPGVEAVSFREQVLMESGLDLAANNSVSLPDFGTGDTHCVYIGFTSDVGYSPCDGLYPNTIGKALVIDNIDLVDVDVPMVEDFEAALNPRVSFVNMHESSPFGEWARTFERITDNDICTENTTCAWLWTDDQNPTIANDPSMAFAPGGFVIRNWLDDQIASPWVSIAETPNATQTVLQYRRFAGNTFGNSRIVLNWSILSATRKNIGGVPDSLCQINFPGHAFSWSGLGPYTWEDRRFDISGTFFQPVFDPNGVGATDIRVRFRVSDWQHINNSTPPAQFVPGPGPFIDRVRIGRLVPSGPSVGHGGRGAAQDAFPTEIDPIVSPLGEHFRPTTDRFGTAAFSRGGDLGTGFTSPNVITGDSVAAFVLDLRDAGITSIDWYGAVVSGPHSGKAPPPWSVGGNGFFNVLPDSARWSQNGQIIEGAFFVDLDDTYFRGGDVLHYFWLASDGLGAVTSSPRGLSGIPASVAEAQEATEGLWEVSYLPTINWDPGYLARIAADDHGDLEPTLSELANSSQANCILYVQSVNFGRRSGDINRTSFMYTLDRLGYRGSYDVYDHAGGGNVNNQLGSRATIQQAQGYNLIVNDGGNGGGNIPDGSDLDVRKVDQAGWYRSWLGQAAQSEASFATLWVIASNALEGSPTQSLYTTDMGVVLAGADQALNANPDVVGEGSFSFAQNGGASCVADFAGDIYALNGGCPTIRDYDALGSSGTAVETHRYKAPNQGAVGDAAIVMNGNPAGAWNTVFQSHPWFDIRDAGGTTTQAEEQLLSAILSCALPIACQQAIDPTDVPDDGPGVDVAPLRSALHRNVPNPFNPTTTIRFDLARSGHVELLIYDVAGRLVRGLVDAKLGAGRDHAVTWNGLDDTGAKVSSGVYFYRINAPGFTATRKMVVLQ